MENETNIKNKTGMGTGIIIGILATLCFISCGYIVYDKVLSEKKDDNQVIEKQQNNNENINDNKEQDIYNESVFDITKFDNTKNAINGPNIDGYHYVLEQDFNLENFGVKTAVSEDKKTVTLTVDIKKFYEKYNKTTDYSGIRTYQITNFSGKVKSVYDSGFGQSIGQETLFFLMEDGTVEYLSMFENFFSGEKYNEIPSIPNSLKSAGKLDNVIGVTLIHGATGFCELCVSSGHDIIGIKNDGSFYDLSSILYKK